MIAIHGGAGVHLKNESKFCANALKESNGDLVNAVMRLEKSALFNCGCGSNLTVSGRVECEAAYMTAERMAFGAVAAVTQCTTPVFAAKALASPYQNCAPNWDLVPPICLVGDGANEYCRSIGAEIVEIEQLCSADARRNFTKASKLVQQFENGRLDTVGGVAIHRDGRSESCVSSGGLILKRDGRLGHCSQFGAAIWSERRGEKSVAVSLSGCGEALLRTHLAEKLAKIFLESDEDDDVLLMQKIQNFLVKEFTNSSRLEAFPMDRRLFGGLILARTADFAELFVFHNTPHFVFAYSDGNLIKRQKSVQTSSEDIVFHSFIL